MDICIIRRRCLFPLTAHSIGLWARLESVFMYVSCRHIHMVSSASCAFSAFSSLLLILWNSSRRHSVLMLLSLSSVTNLSLFFGFCAAWMLSYRCLQMEWWAAVTVVAIPSQPALLMWPCVSAARPSVLSPRASRAILHSPAEPTPCWLHLAYFCQETGCLCISCHCHAQLSPLLPWDFWTLKYFPSINLPASCLSMKSATHVP